MKVVVALYPDPVEGYPPKYARETVPNVGLESCPSDPWNQKHFKPGQLLGCKSGELGLRKWLEERGHTLVVTTDKDGAGCELEKNLHDADVVISQPFWPAYLTADRIKMAPSMSACLPFASFCPLYI